MDSAARAETMNAAYGCEVKNQWKLLSDRYFTPEAAVRTWQSIRNAGLLPPSEADITVVSPSAWLPTHELAILEDESRSRQGQVKVLAGDIRTIPLQENNFPTRIHEGNHKFQYFRWDAASLPLAAGSIDALWDRRGWTWHASKDPALLSAALTQYYELLSDKGILILDADVSSPLEIVTFNGASYTPEASTAAMSNNSVPGIWNQLSSHFSIHDLGTGRQSVRVLRKISNNPEPIQLLVA